MINFLDTEMINFRDTGSWGRENFSIEKVTILNLKLFLNGVETNGFIFFYHKWELPSFSFIQLFLEVNGIISNGYNFNCKLAHSNIKF